MKKLILFFLILIVLGIFLSGCTPTTSTNPGEVNVDLGNSTLKGVVNYFDKPTNQSANIKVTLIAESEDSPVNLNSYYVITGNNGFYEFKNIPSGTYLLIAQDVNKNYQPANIILTIGENETKTAETMILTKVIKHVIIFRESASAWNEAGIPETVIGDILSSIGMSQGTGQNQYEYRTLTGENPNLSFNMGDLIIIEGDQPQAFYDIYTTNKTIFDNFVYNGGTIFWIACDMGWASGNFTSTLPGGVTWRDSYDSYNDIVYFEHPITKNFPTQLYGNYASHGGFDNLNSTNIANLMIYVKETTGDGSIQYPTYVEYRYNMGRVLATTSPLEWYVVNGNMSMPEGYNTTYKDLFKLMLVRSIKYIMNLEVSPDIPPSVESVYDQKIKLNLNSHK
ncbi:carboxypeptidase regulatory-like domain-containing protein [Dictyoglomus thermophilum]|uniref:Carboxypeptidase regulatory-like domain-containing protein n=1 Tax=Dictyoglomus thermophilum TaxID=14 RepID=A0A7V4DXM4_DICTH|nr:carboxypeptidase-like regulatory domain-containing protein [Dictyoglomus thermophilum]TYT23321.1 carboxypeptidase regulatory-like domain-containing protein [Dictyoglomus thermophilum]